MTWIEQARAAARPQPATTGPAFTGGTGSIVSEATRLAAPGETLDETIARLVSQGSIQSTVNNINVTGAGGDPAAMASEVAARLEQLGRRRTNP